MRLFVTGTDTEVGKTVVTACLAEALRGRGTVIAAKPIASGVARAAHGGDACAIAEAAGHAPLIFQSWEAPVSPHRAAIDADQPLDAVGLKTWVHDLTADSVLVEGVGGWRVPLSLSPRVDVADLARWTGGSILVVAADRLGVLNHTLLTVEAIRRQGLRVAGVVLNRGASPDGDSSCRTNRADLLLLLDVPVTVLGPIDVTDPAVRIAAGRTLLTDLAC